MSIRSDACILGLHVTGDQSAAALFRGGAFVAAVAEERLTRQKRSRAFPQKAIAWCLQRAGLTSLNDVDHVVVSWNPTAHMKQINMSGFTSWRRYDPEWLYIVPNNLMDLLPDVSDRITTVDFGLGGAGKIVYVNHHDAHLGWAFASPFESAALAVVDEYGEASSFTLARVDGNRITRLREMPFPHSLGVFYATFTEFLGFRPNSDEWKVMGAAAYGDPGRFKGKILEIVQIAPGAFRLNQDFFEFANTRFGGYFREALPAHLGLAPRADDGPLEQVHFDLAAACQAVFETALFNVLHWLHDQVKLPRLVMNGGCCMNSLANGKVLANTPFEELFISPAPADNGCCIGAPLWLLGTSGQHDAPLRLLVPAYTGPESSDAEIEELLQRYKLSYRHSLSLLGDTVALLLVGKIVGWFQGQMEFGERALGNRSILADPRDAAMKDKINRSVKYRESFRPFAPAVTASAAHAWFDLPPKADSRYMEQVYPVRPDRRAAVPAVVHHDGTGRLQTVCEGDNPLFHALLGQFERATGVPILLNTSFNINGEPIVAHPEDALRTYVTSGIDALVIGSFILEKQPLKR